MSGDAMFTFRNVMAGQWDAFIEENAALARAAATRRVTVRDPRGRVRTEGVPRMAEAGAAAGRSLVLCGAGPSLREHWEHYLDRGHGVGLTPETDVWACNSAITFLLDRGAQVTHAFGIDGDELMLADEVWGRAPVVAYMVASTINPKVTRHLVSHGRALIWFHNFVGSPREMDLYRALWPTTIMAGDGLNSVCRALALALAMGFRHVTVLGADNAVGRDNVWHAAGDGPDGVLVSSRDPINGRTWSTKPEMLFSAVVLARFAMRGGVTLVGETLPNALLAEAARAPEGGNAWLDRVSRLEEPASPRETDAARDVTLGRNMVSDLFAVPAPPP